MRYIIFDATGKIKCISSGAPPQNFCLNGEQFLPMDSASASVSSAEQWVDLTVNPPAITPRPTMPTVVNKTSIVANGADTAIFSNIPNNTVCTYDGEDHVVTDGLIEFTADHDGDYTFTFTLFPYLPLTITITATEPTS